MNKKKRKSMEEIDVQAAAITLLVLVGLIAFNFLVMLIPNDIVKFSIIGIEILTIAIGLYALTRALDDIINRIQ